MRLVAYEARAYLETRYGNGRDFTWADVKRTCCKVPSDGHSSTLVARRRIMRIMFGTTDPDLRALSDEGKIWHDESSRMRGTGN